jgi:mediator of replication checkpoint protein 1
LDIDESDDDEDEDEHAARIRRQMRKKRKVEGDSLEALGRWSLSSPSQLAHVGTSTGQDEATRPFYEAYQRDLVDDPEEFGYPQEDILMVDGEEETQETVSVNEIRARAREITKTNEVRSVVRCYLRMLASTGLL